MNSEEDFQLSDISYISENENDISSGETCFDFSALKESFFDLSTDEDNDIYLAAASASSSSSSSLVLNPPGTGLILQKIDYFLGTDKSSTTSTEKFPWALEQAFLFFSDQVKKNQGEMFLFLEHVKTGTAKECDFCFYKNNFFISSVGEDNSIEDESVLFLIIRILSKLPHTYWYFFDKKVNMQNNFVNYISNPDTFEPFMTSILAYRIARPLIDNFLFENFLLNSNSRNDKKLTSGDSEQEFFEFKRDTINLLSIVNFKSPKLTCLLSSSSSTPLEAEETEIEKESKKLFIQNAGIYLIQAQQEAAKEKSKRDATLNWKLFIAQLMADAFLPKYFFMIREKLELEMDPIHDLQYRMHLKRPIYYQSAFCKHLYDYVKKNYWNKNRGFSSPSSFSKQRVVEHLIRYFNLVIPSSEYLKQKLSLEYKNADMYTIFTGLYGSEIFTFLPGDASDIPLIKFLLESKFCTDLISSLHRGHEIEESRKHNELWKCYFEKPYQLFYYLVENQTPDPVPASDSTAVTSTATLSSEGAAILARARTPRIENAGIQEKTIKSFMRQVWDVLKEEIAGNKDGTISERFEKTGIRFNIFELAPRGSGSTRTIPALRKEVEIRALSCLFLDFYSMFAEIVKSHSSDFSFSNFLVEFFRIICLDLVTNPRDQEIVKRANLYTYGPKTSILESVEYFFLQEKKFFTNEKLFEMITFLTRISQFDDLLKVISLNPFQQSSPWKSFKISLPFFILGKFGLDDPSARKLFDQLITSGHPIILAKDVNERKQNLNRLLEETQKKKEARTKTTWSSGKGEDDDGDSEFLKMFPFLATNSVIEKLLLEKQKLKDLGRYKVQVMYHGTSALYLPYIVKNGLSGKFPNDFIHEHLDSLMYYFFIFAYILIINDNNYYPDSGIHKLFKNLNVSIREKCNDTFLMFIEVFYNRNRQYAEYQSKFFTPKLLTAYAYSFGEIGEGPFHLLQIPVLFESQLLRFWDGEIREHLNEKRINKTCEKFFIPETADMEKDGKLSASYLRFLIENCKKLFKEASKFSGLILAIDMEDPFVKKATENSIPANRKNRPPLLTDYEFLYEKTDFPPEKLFLCLDCRSVAEKEIEKLRLEFTTEKASRTTRSSSLYSSLSSVPVERLRHLNKDDKYMLFEAKNYDMSGVTRSNFISLASLQSPEILKQLESPSGYQSVINKLKLEREREKQEKSRLEKEKDAFSPLRRKRARKDFTEDLETRLKILTYNVNWKTLEGNCNGEENNFECIENIGKIIKFEDYDVIGLQEINLQNEVQANSFASFLDTKEKYNVFYSSSSSYSSLSLNSGNVTMIKKSFMNDSDRAFAVLDGEFLKNRPVLIVILDDPKIVHINVHYPHDYELSDAMEEGSNPLQLHRLYNKLLSEKVIELLSPYKEKLFLERYNFIVAGDFNRKITIMPPSLKEKDGEDEKEDEDKSFLQDILVGLEMDDKKSFSFWPYELETCCADNNFSLAFDYIFTTMGDAFSYGVPKISEMYTKELLASDHFPIELEIYFKNKN